MKAYSFDLRLRIMQAVDTGQSKASVARRFAVGLSTVKRYLAQQEADATPVKRRPGPVPRIGPDDLVVVRDLVRATPDATLTEHATAWEQAVGKRVSQWTMGRAVRGMKLTRKKRA